MQKAEQAEFKPFDASQWHIGIVVAKFNKRITDSLYDSAIKRAAEYGIPEGNIDTVEVAGSVEVPLALQAMAKSGKYDALLAIGCVIKGETPHFDYVCKFATEGVLRVQLDFDMPIGFGILTCNDEAQAEARMRLGGEHLDAVMQLAKAIND
jgi:6,7-dimethyl-8-ribityllumazine synthase